MKTFIALVKRNVKIFFKDKGAFFSSLITPLILLVLYATFLAKIYRDSFVSSLKGCHVANSLIDGTVAGQLFSSLLAVCCVTVAFCSNMISVQDRVTGAANDLLVSPVKRSAAAVSYSVAAFISTLIVTLTATAVSLIYVATVGWYMSFTDVLLVILDVVLLSAFGTLLSSVITAFLSSQGQVQAVGTIVSAGYGFICGAYMPISQFGDGLQTALGFLPGTYGTMLLRNHALNGVYSNFPPEVIKGIKDGIDCNIYFFGNKVEIWVAYLVLIGSIVLLTALYILIYALRRRKNK